MLVAAKTYEREQTSEKVRFKMRMRAEKGMGERWPDSVWLCCSGCKSHYRTLKTVLNEMFLVYVETGTDFKVRDWSRRIKSQRAKEGQFGKSARCEKL